ncbi:BTB/POZ-like protein [Artemisia annua]|uniref:BTB/POZ-like protein n=1 Tax=Artemisia annua TaxID=35608 RepID=A0A2U1KV76_ARTAN|nr:BTB/POZ-like protein [Artemisia annua]
MKFSLQAISIEENMDDNLIECNIALLYFNIQQVEYMLGDDDEEIPLVIAEVATDKSVMQSLSDLNWICNILSKMDLMKEFVDQWADFSNRLIEVTEDKLLISSMWSLKLIILTGKVLDAVGYGNMIMPRARRVELLKTWLPYFRKTKPALDSIGNEETGYPYKMDEDLCQSIEGAIVALLSAFPLNDQADILADWMNWEQFKYPDLSEAFEIWCYRTKSAKGRLVEGLDRVGNATVSL